MRESQFEATSGAEHIKETVNDDANARRGKGVPHHRTVGRDILTA